MRTTFLALLFLSVTASAVAATDPTGLWSGTFEATIPCVSNNTFLRIAGPLTVSVNLPLRSTQFVALGTAFAAFPDNALCKTRGAASLPIRLNGASDGTALSDVTVLLPVQGAFRVNGSLTDSKIALSGPGDLGGSISINLERVDSQVPTSFRTTEHYSGTYTFTADYSFRCNNVATVSASGTADLTVLDVGRGVAGSFRLSNFPIVKFAAPTSNGGCIQQTGNPANVELQGTLSAGTDNTFTGFLQTPDFIPVRGKFDLATLEATAVTPGGGSLVLQLKNSVPLRQPAVQQFFATDPSIATGEPTRLVWRVWAADKVTIDNGVGDQPAVGVIAVRPDRTTVYKLTATTAGGTDTKTVTVTVQDLPIVQIGDLPDGMVERPNVAGATDSFALVNRGAAPTTITLASTDDFYTFAPSSFSLAPRTAQRVAIVAKAKPAGVYRGSINVAATGGGPVVNIVPVGLAVIDAPASGTVRPEVSSRIEVKSEAGQNTSVTVPIANRGTAPLIGIATSKAPFVIPEPGLVTIPPGQTVGVKYEIDVARRPLDLPIGAATSKISILYPGGSARPSALADRATTSSVSTTVTHVVTPTVGPGIPPPLLDGELALIVAGLANKSNSVGDLLLANIQSTPLSSFALFISGGGSVATSAALPQILPNSSISLPGVMANLVGTTSSTGTAQLRGADASRTSIAAIQSNTSLPAGTYSTALPVLRSDRATASQGTVVLTGLEKSAAAQTNLFVQEMSGAGGSFSIDFLDNAGHVVASQPARTIDGFGFAELDDAAPAGATAARITNTSTDGRLSAYALVTNAATNDGWLVTDPSAGSTDSSLIVPVFPAGFTATTTLYTTNRSQSPVSVTIEQPSTPRRRAVGHGSISPPLLQTEQTLSIGPLETNALPIATTGGFIRITAPAGSVSAAARSVVTSGTTAFGSGLPAVPISTALLAGQGRRFSAIDDASAASRQDEVPATFRTSVLLVETNRQSVVVRLTLQFTVDTSQKTTSTAVATKDYTIAAGQFVNIADLGSELIGASRSTTGDIRDATLDVQVLSGSGAVLPFVASVDNGSGDLIVRTE